MNEEDYMQVRHADIGLSRKILIQHDFLKLSAKINLDQWNESEHLLLRLYRIILQSLK
jgi:hypothetical protein